MNNISPTLDSKNIFLERKLNNLPVFNGGLGENPLSTPDFLLDSISSIINLKDYTSIEGKEIFRNELFKNYPNYMDNIIVGNGLKELIFTLIFNWEGKIFIPTPCWVTYLEDLKILNKDFKCIECSHINNYKLDYKLYEESLIENNGSNSLLILNNPTNPTGSVYSENELHNLVKICRKYNITVFSDEIYFNTSQINTISLSHIYEKCIIGSSLSKDWASGGWRFGWMIFTKNLKNIHSKMISFGSIMYSCPSDFFNNVATEAIGNNKKYEHFEIQKKYFNKINELVDNELQYSDIITSNFEGAWYKWFDLKNYSKELESINISKSNELVKVLGNKIGLIVVPGICFGLEGLTFRLSMIDKDIYKGIKELIKFLNQLKCGTKHTSSCSSQSSL